MNKIRENGYKITFALIWGTLFAFSASAETDRNLRPASIQLPIFFLERMTQERLTFTHEHWVKLNHRASISTQLCRPIQEILQPYQLPLRSVLVKATDDERYSGTFLHRFAINQSCGSSLEFELNLAMTWMPSLKRVEIRVFGTDHHRNRSGAADWEFEIEDENPSSIDIVVPQDSFQSGIIMDDVDANDSTGNACAGMRVTSMMNQHQ